MARAIWSGAISFGLVNVPVKLFSAVNKKTVRFNQLEEETGARIQQKRVSAKTGEEVPFEKIVKGFEIAKDRYVVIKPEELDALDPKKTRTIDIQEFVDQDQIDPIYYDHPYYLAPDRGADKPYNLLFEAMREANKVAIARVVIRSKESLTLIRPMEGGVLGMTTMLFADEVVPPENLDDLPDAKAEASASEVKMAQQLIESLSGDFEPGKYRDEYREAVLDMIDRKAAGQEISVSTEEEEEVSEVPDLMAALEASVAAAKERGGGAQPAAKKPSAKSKATAKKPAAKKPAAKKRATAASKK
ncbi:MAG: end-binding protein Ku [Thermoleophilaceae bacterium]|jgi:DNA end-binding protein Ku|nr:end-binding protein Ku [Thermoleophilaceae bacterium]